MRNFFSLLIFLTFISFSSFASNETLQEVKIEMEHNLEHARERASVFSQSMEESSFSFGKYHYWLGRIHAFEHCLFLITFFDETEILKCQDVQCEIACFHGPG